MLSAKIKDLKLRKKLFNTELSKTISKFLFINILANKRNKNLIKKKAFLFLAKNLNKYESKTKVVRRCVLTNRSRVNYRVFGISRIKLREFLRAGLLSGYNKAIW